MKLLFGLILSSIVSIAQANTVLTLCNENSDRKIFVSYMKQVGGGAGWQSIGWFGIDSSKCRDLDLGKYSGKVFLHANDEFKETSWGESDVQYCVHSTNAFSINNADTAPCNAPGQERVKSDSITVQEGTTRYSFKPNFSQVNLCNLNTDIPVFAAVAKETTPGSLQSKGWYNIAATKCQVITIGKYSGKVQIYGEYNGGDLVWGSGPDQICVNRTKPFLIDNAQNAAICSGSELKMVLANSVQVSTGITTVNFDAQSLKTTLRLCNKTPDKVLNSVYGTKSQNGTIRSVGWVEIKASECKEIDLSTYEGPTYLYAETDGGSSFWGTGPVEICAVKDAPFVFEDGGNAPLCNADIKNKMVPTFEFNVSHGLNTFAFQP